MGKDDQGGYGGMWGERGRSLGSRIKDSAGILCPIVAKCTIIITFV